MEGETTRMVAQCLDRVRAGDSLAKNDLLAHACNRLTHLAKKMSRDFRVLQRWEGTDDALQNALIRLHRVLESVIPESPRQFFRLAALQIRRELLDLVRQYRGPYGAAANHDSLPGERPPSVVDNPSASDPARLAEWTEFHQQLNALPDEQREMVDLLWYHELSQEEVAELLGISVRTVKRRWQQTRLKLHEALRNTKQIHD